jgi:hypothetical protein
LPHYTLTVADIQNGLATTRALRVAAEDTARGHHRRGRMVLSLQILPNAIADLARLGWLDAASRGHNGAVADAVVELVERAIELGLRPR